MDGRVVPVARFTGVAKPAAVKGPATAPIIPGVAILARPGICPKTPESLLVTSQRKLSLKQLKW